MYRVRGFGDASGVTTTPAQGAPLATVSQYALPSCGFGQKTVGNGPFTCQFDLATAAAQAWQAPGVILERLRHAGIMNLSANAYSAIGWGIITAARMVHVWARWMRHGGTDGDAMWSLCATGSSGGSDGRACSVDARHCHGYRSGRHRRQEKGEREIACTGWRQTTTCKRAGIELPG